MANSEMLNLVENVAEIAKITNYRGSSIANGDVCLEKTYLLMVTWLRFYSNSLIPILHFQICTTQNFFKPNSE